MGKLEFGFRIIMGGCLLYLMWYIIANDKPVALVAGLVNLLLLVIAGQGAVLPANTTTIINDGADSAPPAGADETE